MTIKSISTFAVFLFHFSGLWSQGVYSAGILPQINLNIPLSKEWRMNTKVESRQLFFEGKINKDFKTTYRYDLTDIAFIASRRTGANSSFGIGYMIRFRGNSVIHRFIQQYSTVKKYDQFRLGHRISTDQTIHENNAVQLRLRYRVGLEKPLSGKDVDSKEFYFKLNNEYLFSNQGSINDVELRLIPVLGYSFNDFNKFECGIDYRISKFISDDPVNQLWLNMGWFISM